MSIEKEEVYLHQLSAIILPIVSCLPLTIAKLLNWNEVATSNGRLHTAAQCRRGVSLFRRFRQSPKILFRLNRSECTF